MKEPKKTFCWKKWPPTPSCYHMGLEIGIFFPKKTEVCFFKAKPASWKVIINYLLGVSLVQLLQWIQWERQGVPMLTQQSPSLMVILQIVNLLDNYCHVSAPGDCQQRDSLQRHLVRSWPKTTRFALGHCGRHHPVITNKFINAMVGSGSSTV